MQNKNKKLKESKIYQVKIHENGKMDLFREDEDRARFIINLYERTVKSKFTLYAYCLLDNHVHLLIGDEENEFGEMIKALNRSYSGYYYRKYGKMLHLMQDRAEVDVNKGEEGLLEMVKNIHNQPVQSGICIRPSDYFWSSYNAYIRENGSMKSAVNTGAVLNKLSGDFSEAVQRFKRISAYEAG